MNYEIKTLIIILLTTTISSCGQNGNDNKERVKIDIDKILKIEDAPSALMELHTKLNEISNYSEDIAKLTESQKVVLIVENLEGEINNGGFNQFFFNSSGDFTHETVEALKKIKAFRTADIVSKSISVWPNQNVPKDRFKRQDIMDQIENQANKVWNQCDTEFSKYEDNIAKLVMDFVKANKSDF